MRGRWLLEIKTKGFKMEDNELFENDEVVETEAEVMNDENDEEVAVGFNPVAAFGIGTIVGIAIHKFVVPAVGNALNAAREGVVKLLTKDYTEIEKNEEDSEKTEK